MTPAHIKDVFKLSGECPNSARGPCATWHMAAPAGQGAERNNRQRSKMETAPTCSNPHGAPTRKTNVQSDARNQPQCKTNYHRRLHSFSEVPCSSGGGPVASLFLSSTCFKIFRKMSSFIFALSCSSTSLFQAVIGGALTGTGSVHLGGGAFLLGRLSCNPDCVLPETTEMCTSTKSSGTFLLQLES